MKKPLSLLILNALFLIPNSFSFAQNKNIDSLLTLLKNDKADTNKVIHSYKLCSEYKDIGLYDTALHYGNAALQLAQQLNFKMGIAKSFHTIGIVYCLQNNYTKALDYWSKALKLFEELKIKKGIAAVFGNFGIVYRNQGDYPKALDYYLKALKIDEELGYKNHIATWLGNIGSVYVAQKDYFKALE